MKEWLILALVLLFLCAAMIIAAVKALQCPTEGAERSCIVLPVSGHEEDIELRVRSLVSRTRRLRGAAIILADFGADSETAEIARRLCREFGTVECLSPEELAERLKEMVQ